MKLNKIALAVAVAGGAMAVHTAAQADSVFFPYVVYGGAVTTVINIIDNKPTRDDNSGSYYNGDKLHYVLVRKIGNDALDNSAGCIEDNDFLPSSPGDLQTIDLGAHFTAAEDLGVMFNDPGVKNDWNGEAAASYALAFRAGGGY